MLQVALIAAVAADLTGNLYTRPNIEDTPTGVEATAFTAGSWWRKLTR